MKQFHGGDDLANSSVSQTSDDVLVQGSVRQHTMLRCFA
jgi:hypothetical protein